MTTKPLRSEFLFEVRADLVEPEPIGDTPHGDRQIYYVTGGTFEGPKLKGKVRSGGGDWLVNRSDGVSELDVRATIETHDGALIYVFYRGLLHIPPETAERIERGETVDHSEYYFRTTPMFETASPQYEWLNRTIAIGVGEFGTNWVAYSIYAIL